ncbi:Centrosomal protein of 41 kDa [Mactra antiquata]
MSAVSTSRPKKSDPMSKKVPVNPKYKNVKATVDTGASITKYMERIEDIRTNYKYKKDEIFKRMKVTTFVQLVFQVAEYELSNAEAKRSNYDNGSYRPDTADLEVDKIQRGGGDSPAPSLAVTEGDYGAKGGTTDRATLLGLIEGKGELSQRGQEVKSNCVQKEVLDGCPYLLLDVRDKDSYDECHITTAKNYPSAKLSMSVNYETKEMLAFKNHHGKIIIVYDENEQIANKSASVLLERGYENVFLLSGGMKVAYKIIPEGLFTGVPPVSVTETPRSTRHPEHGSKNEFTPEDLDKISFYLDAALCDKSTGSRLSKASTASSRMSNFSSSTKGGYKTSQSGRASHQAPFKP